MRRSENTNTKRDGQSIRRVYMGVESGEKSILRVQRGCRQEVQGMVQAGKMARGQIVVKVCGSVSKWQAQTLGYTQSLECRGNLEYQEMGSDHGSQWSQKRSIWDNRLKELWSDFSVGKVKTRPAERMVCQNESE